MKTRKNMISILGCLLVIVLIICFMSVFLTSCQAKKIHLNDYITVNFSGYDGNGVANVVFDKEQFYLDNISKITFKDKSAEMAFDALNDDDYAYIDFFYNCVSKAKIIESGSLSNGDEVVVDWNIDYDYLSKYFAIDVICDEEKITVNGLKYLYENISQMSSKIYEISKIEINKTIESSSDNEIKNVKLTEIYYLKVGPNNHSLCLIYQCDWHDKQAFIGIPLNEVYYNENEISEILYKRYSAGNLAPISYVNYTLKTLKDNMIKESIIIDHVTVSGSLG